MQTRLPLRLSGAIALCLGLAGGCEDRERRARQAAAALPTLNLFKAKLAAIGRSLPDPATLAERTCDDAEVAKALDGLARTEHPIHVDVEFLREIQGGPRRPFLHGPVPELGWLVSPRMQLFQHQTGPDGDDLGPAAVYLLEARRVGGNLLVVLQVTKHVKPQETGSHAGILWDKKTYRPGEFEGWSLVYSLEATPRLLCQARIEAKSSDTVESKSGNFAQGLHDDYVRQIRRAIDRSMQRISPRLRVKF